MWVPTLVRSRSICDNVSTRVLRHWVFRCQRLVAMLLCISDTISIMICTSTVWYFFLRPLNIRPALWKKDGGCRRQIHFTVPWILIPVCSKIILRFIKSQKKKAAKTFRKCWYFNWRNLTIAERSSDYKIFVLTCPYLCWLVDLIFSSSWPMLAMRKHTQVNVKLTPEIYSYFVFAFQYHLMSRNL